MSLRARTVIAFIAINLALFLLAELTLRKYSKILFYYESYFSSSVDYFEKKASVINILFLGDSRVYYGVNPDVIPLRGCAIHNFAFPSEGIQSTYYKLEYYLSRGALPNLKFVFVPIRNPESISDKPFLQKGHALSWEANYSKYYPLNQMTPHLSIFDEMKTFFFNSNVIRLRRHTAGKRLLRPSKVTLLPNGYSKRTTVYTPIKSDEKEYLKSMQKQIDDADSNEWELFYKKTASALERRGVQPIFVLLPDLWHAPELRKDYVETLSGFVERNIPGSTFLDYTKNRFNWLNKDFADRGHLNIDGAHIFGQLIADDIKRLFKCDTQTNKSNSIGCCE